MSKQQIPNKPKAPNIPSSANPILKLKTSLGLIIAAFAFLLYAQTISYSYTLDDNAALKNNTVTKQGIAAIPIIFSHNYWYGINDLKGHEYRPLSMVMFAIEWQFFPDTPAVYRFINVLLYALSCWLLFNLLCQLFASYNLVIPFICSLLFAAHPIHTEVIGSIKSRDDILCLLFLILSALSLLKVHKSNTVTTYLLAGFCFLLALLSKETAVSFLVVMPLLLYVFTTANLKSIGKVIILLLFASGMFFLFRFLALETVTHPPDTSAYNNSLHAANGFLSREATAFFILLKYIFLLILPHPLCYDYSFNQIPLQRLSDPLAILGILVYVALGIYAVIKIITKDSIAFAILLFLITLAPVSNVFVLIGATMAERFLYIPSLGFCMAAAILLAKVTRTEIVKSNFKTVKQFVGNNTSLMTIVFIIAGLYSIKTFARRQNWKNNAVLYAHDSQIASNSSRAHVHNAISIYSDLYPIEKNEAAKKELLDKSISEMQRALDIFDNYHITYQGLGEMYLEKKDYKNAIIYFEKELQKFPKDAGYNPYKFLITCYEKTEQLDKQIAADDSILKYEPNNDFTYTNKGVALGKQGKFAEAIELFQKSIAINPKETAPYKNIGAAYGYQGQFQKAIEYLNKAFLLDSSDIQCSQFLGLTYKNMGNTAKAKYYLEKANRMSNKQQKHSS